MGQNRAKKERNNRKLSVKKLFDIPGCPKSLTILLFIHKNIIDDQSLAKATQNSRISCEIAQNRGKSRKNKTEEFFSHFTMAILYSNERYLRAQLIGVTYFNIYMSIVEK